MNIAMFTNTYIPHVGGVARSVSTFTEDLRQRGHRVLVIAPEYSAEDDTSAEEDDVIRIPAIQNFNGSDFSMRIPVPFLIEEKLDAFGPDLIHSHHPYLLGDTALRIARKQSLPIAFTHHTLYEKYTHYVTEDSESLPKFVKHLSTEYANLCDQIIAPSESIKQLISSRGVKRPVEVVPTGVDVNFFSQGNGADMRRRLGIPDGATVIGHLGRLAPEKNIPFLVDSILLAMEDISDSHFLVVGEGPNEAEIRMRFSDTSLEERLHMAGKRTGADLADAYHAMDFFVFASKTETQGLVLAEAMAAGKPVIALDASGSREVVEDQVNGRLLPVDAPKSQFAQAVREMASNATMAAEWSENARQTAKRFSRNASLNQLLDLYENMRAEKMRKKTLEAVEEGPLEELRRRIKAEWDLAAEKMAALTRTAREDPE
ncbi:MAG: glycosyltransferase [Desulfobacteraceae bacterium]|nr:glycosyltransferase [Desulfobacteraceae bacterium]